jgi:pyridoxal/pyridoxine/pyridoxamine kinase
MRFFLIVTFMMFSMLAPMQGQEKIECEGIVNAIKNAEVTELSPYLANTVECDMFGKSNVYSKAQTMQVMKDFFSQNKPKQFVVNHQSGQGETRFFIGTYKTIAGKKYRISCSVKQESGKTDVIRQIRIEDYTDNQP